MELRNLLDLTAEYILEGWNEKSPTYTENPQIRQFPHYDIDEYIEAMFPPIQEGIADADLTRGATKMPEKEAFEKINKNIENSQENQVLEYCSGAGIRFANEFAKKHPKTNIILADRLDDEYFADTSGLFNKAFEKKLRSMGKTEEEIKDIVYGRGFTRYEKEAEFKGNTPRFMQELFKENNIKNINYTHRLVEANTNWPEISPEKKLYCIGWNCPAGAGIRSLQNAIKNNAEAIAITISGMEFITPELSKLSSHNVSEWDYLMSLAKAGKNFNYCIPKQKKLGFALKHAKTLDLLIWLEEKGYNARLVLLDEPKSYNTPEHIIYAYKKHDIL